MALKRTPLPGVGTQYDFSTREGRHISVVVHDDGRRFVGFFDPEDPDTCQATVPLEMMEAAKLAAILAPRGAEAIGAAVHKASGGGEIDIDLVTEKIPIPADSPYRGRPLGDTRARTRTGASIVAVLRRTGAHHPAPGPDHRLEAGDTLVAVGTREGVSDLADILNGLAEED
ncbi:cation:proton antiporter regulatory subunit [Streptomyces sp. 4N509B]|uniref:cation:proton antiporter regulatory subunit n=1 Tax=Streptomyces sp. 4N509B TaxID=3457413 RepID=UPI003FD286BE